MKKIDETRESVLLENINQNTPKCMSARLDASKNIHRDMLDALVKYYDRMCIDVDLTEENLQQTIEDCEEVLGKLLAYKDYFFE